MSNNAPAPVPGADGKPASKLTRTEQAAILLMSVGEVTAAEILKHMGPKRCSAFGYRHDAAEGRAAVRGGSGALQLYGGGARKRVWASVPTVTSATCW